MSHNYNHNQIPYPPNYNTREEYDDAVSDYCDAVEAERQRADNEWSDRE
jgi:hypothetical protein